MDSHREQRNSVFIFVNTWSSRFTDRRLRFPLQSSRHTLKTLSQSASEAGVETKSTASAASRAQCKTRISSESSIIIIIIIIILFDSGNMARRQQ